MADGQSATRDVIFRLNTALDKDALATAKKYGDELVKIQKRATDETGKARSAADNAAARQLERAMQREQKAQEKSSKAFERALQNERKARDKASREAGKAFDREITDRIKQRERDAADARKKEQEADREAERLHKRKRQRQKSIAAQNRKDRLEAAKEQEKATAAAERQMATAVGRMSASNGLLVEGLTSTGDALLKMSTGLATIGLLSEENSEKMLRGLILIRGVNDALAGSVELYVRIGKLVTGYKETLAAIKAMEEAIAARAAVGAAVGGAGARGGRGGGAAGGGVAGNVAGLAAAQTGLTGIQKAAARLGSALGPLAALLGKTAVGAAGTAATLAVGLPVVADMIGSLVSTGSTGPRKGSVRESFSNEMGGLINSLSMYMKEGLSDQAIRNQAAGGNQTAGAVNAGRMSSRQLDRMSQYLADEAERTIELVNTFQEEQDKASLALGPLLQESNRLEGGAALPSLDRVSATLQAQERNVQGMSVSGMGDSSDPFAVLAQSERLLELENSQLETLKRRGDIEKDIARTKTDAAREDLRASREAVEVTQDRIRILREGMLTAQERFADLSSEDQQKVLDIGRRAKAGETVSTEERGLLRQYGGSLGEDIARQQAVALTQQTDYGGVFLAEQQKELSKLEQSLQGPTGLQAKLEDKRNLVLEFEQSEEQIADRVAETVAKQLEERDARIMQLIEAKLNARDEKDRRNVRNETQAMRTALASQ